MWQTLLYVYIIRRVLYIFTSLHFSFVLSCTKVAEWNGQEENGRRCSEIELKYGRSTVVCRRTRTMVRQLALCLPHWKIKKKKLNKKNNRSTHIERSEKQPIYGWTGWYSGLVLSRLIPGSIYLNGATRRNWLELLRIASESACSSILFIINWKNWSRNIPYRICKTP